MITTDNQPIKLEPNIQFIQELIDDLDKAAERKILTYFKNLMKTTKPKRNNGYQVDVFWNCFRMELTTEPVVGETYYLFSIELKEIYRLGGAVTEYYFSAFKEYFKSLLNKLKKDLIDENRDERFIFGQKNDIYVESDSYLQGDFPLEILSENQLKMFFSYVFKTNETLFGLIEDNGKVVEELGHYQQYIDEVIATLRLLGISYFLDDDDNFKRRFQENVVNAISNYDESFQTKFYNELLNELLTQLKNTNKKFSKIDLERFISDGYKI